MGIITPWPMDAIPVDPQDPEGEKAPAYDSATLRRVFATFLFPGGGGNTRARSGVVSGGEVVVVDDVAYVEPSLVVVTTQDGSFITGVDSEMAIPLQPRHATNDRRDRVVVRIYHTTVERSASVEVIAGTAAPSPQPPSTPAGAESLGVIDVPRAGGGPAAFTPGQQYTAARGGVIRVPDRAALDRMTGIYRGMQVLTADDETLWIRAGSQWNRQWSRDSGQPYAMATGATIVTGDGSDLAELRVNFPSGRFSVTPNVIATPAGNLDYRVAAGSSSSTGFTMRVRHLDGISFTASVHTRWVAIQATPDDASG